MIRAIDSYGRIIIGISRETLSKMGDSYAISESLELEEDTAATVFIFTGETDAEVMENIKREYTKTFEVRDYRNRGKA